MPATFEGFGVRLMYPETDALRPVGRRGRQGATTAIYPRWWFSFRLKFCVNRVAKKFLAEIDAMLRENYKRRRERIAASRGAEETEHAVDFSFYHLGFGRCCLRGRPDPMFPASTRDQMPHCGRCWLTFPSESRDFDEKKWCSRIAETLRIPVKSGCVGSQLSGCMTQK